MRKSKSYLRRCVSLWVLVAMLIVAVTGCGRSLGGEKGGIRIFFALNEMDTFRETLVGSAAERATQKGVQMDVGDAQGSIEKQVEQLKEAAAKQYDVIICSPVSVVYVGSSEQVAGEFQAEYLLEELSGKQEINVVLIKGPTSHSATEGRTNGVKRTLEKSGKQIQYVFEDSANWDTGQARELFELFLSTGVAADCVICNNDAMALGVVEACKKHGIDGSTLPILGVDATADGCEAIRSGDMAFTVYQSGSGQGHAAVDTAIELAGKGNMKEIEGSTEDGRFVWVDFERVDSGNVSQYAK